MKHQIGENKISFVIVFLLLCLLTVFLCSGVTLPFVGLNAWNFSTYSLIAANFLRFGYIDTAFAPVTSVAQTLPQNPEYYLHHPQFLSIVQSLFFTVFGESYLVARLPVIAASIGSAYLMYRIGLLLFGVRYSLSVLFLSAVTPALFVFGRMIGQEALVLLFVLLTSYSLLLYLKTKEKKYVFLIFASIILGVFSDWPMVYFVVCLAPFMYLSKALKLYVWMVVFAVFSAVLFLIYIYFILGSYDDLINAFLIRSPGLLLTENNWLLRWTGTILFRIGLYFNPVIVTLSVIGGVTAYKNWRETHDAFSALLLSFLLFGLWHIIMYPEGSFGHAYWIIYLLPYVIFSSSRVFAELVREKTALAVLVSLFLLFYAIVINDWKTNETEANLFRYYHGLVISREIPSYSQVAINSESVIDPDLLRYEFSYDVSRIKAVESVSGSEYVIYSCRVACESRDIESIRRQRGLEQVKVTSQDAEVYVFPPSLNNTEKAQNIVLSYTPDESKSFLGRMYQHIKTYLSLPQI